LILLISTVQLNNQMFHLCIAPKSSLNIIIFPCLNSFSLFYFSCLGVFSLPLEDAATSI
jgi:hypothetical protein